MTQRMSLFAAFVLLLGGALIAPAVNAKPTNGQTVEPSTRALFQFHRDDAAPGGVTRITLNAAHIAARPVSQNVFGNFIENLGTVIYDILWADALHNPNLERIETRDLEPQWWDQTGAASWQEAPGSGYLSQRCERLAGPDSTLSQRVYLPAYRTRRYTLTLWTRAPGAEGQITVAVRVGGEQGPRYQPGMEKAGQAVVQTSLSVNGKEWRKQTVHWTLPAGAIAKGQAARFVAAYSGGAVDVDQISLFPNDAVDGMDPEVLRVAKDWHIPILRLAGNYSSGYHWREGVGPREARPTNRNVAWGGVDSHQFGTDEFLELAKRIGATAQIAANAGNGTPEEAAAWVHYCNAKTRRVPLWEIGNELYGDWQIGHTDAPGYAARFVQFRDAMKMADPGIQIMATGQGNEFQPGGLDRDNAWNDAVLRASVANGGQAPDYLTIHPLVGLPGGLADLPYDQRWESVMAHPAFMNQTEIPALIEEITKVEGPEAKTRIAPTEWGIIIGGPRWAEGPNHNVEAGALFNALTLNTFLRNGDWVTLANMTALLHGGSIKKSHGVVYVDPQYYTSQMYAAARPSLPIETDWTGPGRDVPVRGFLPAAQNVPDVDVFSALTSDKDKLVAFVVNRHLTAPRPIHLDLAGFDPSAVSATILTSSDPQAANGWDHPDNVRPQPFPLRGSVGRKTV
ncbi:MAG: hypothetical protein M3Y13_01225, partial [Armatimonadota bacterium]|nr:hypothetical protein [Armatimonadota bacterium]